MLKDPSVGAATHLSGLEESSVLVRRWAVSHELPEGGGTVLFDEVRSELLVLNETGGALWYLLDGERSLAEVCAILVGHFPEGPHPAQALEQLSPVVSQWLERGAVERRR